MATTITVANELQLNQAIAEVDDPAASGSYVIQFATNITEDTDKGGLVPFNSQLLSAPAELYALNLKAGVSVTIDGGGFSLSGANTYRGLFVESGQVTVENLTIKNAVATGGAGGAGARYGGGGGAGLGGGLFVASGGIVTINNVTFVSDSARGGAGGASNGAYDAINHNHDLGGYGGGGGMGGAGGSGTGVSGASGGGGGIGLGASGGNPGSHGSGTNGGDGVVLGAASGGLGVGTPFTLENGGSYGGGGGYGGYFGAGGGGGVGGSNVSRLHQTTGGAGGFVGGGGGAYDVGGAGGFGGGGGGGYVKSGVGGWGGGGAGGSLGVAGGFGGGSGGGAPLKSNSIYGGGGGGGLGAGGSVFVQQGGVLTFGTGSVYRGSVAGGAGGIGLFGAASGSVGNHFGSGIFLQGNEQIHLAPAQGKTLTIADGIADQSGSGGTGANAGLGSLAIDGPGGVVLSGFNTFMGGITINGGKLELASLAAAGGGAVTFAANVTLLLDGTTTLTNKLDNFTPGDHIVLTSIANVAGSHADMNYATNVLTITEGAHSYQLHFQSNQDFSGEFFHLAAVGGGTDISESSVACYCRGTRIATANGEREIEMLGIGDVVRTLSGKLRPIKWIGRRSYRSHFIMGRKDILPVCLKAGSLGESSPRRDLWISPHHAMYFEDENALIEARDLINGISIVQPEQVEDIEYFHVELDSHDVILAEGAASETFIDDGSRGMFHNRGEYAALYPEETAGEPRYCAPRLETGYQIEAIRRRIAERAGLSDAQGANAGPLLGHIDVVGPNSIEGWAQNQCYPDAPVCLDIYANGRLIGQTLANLRRADLHDAGIGSGCHAFKFALPQGLLLAGVEVRRTIDGVPLRSSASAKQAA